jgi:hypothetical protein
MCLPVQPFKVKREWEHAGLQCAVTQAQEAGNHCGYVRVPPGHLLHGVGFETSDRVQSLEVHGGVTFSELEPCTEHADGQGWWLGFDCAHAWDTRYDPEADVKTLSPEAASIVEWARDFAFLSGRHFWTEAEVEAECESLAEQLAAI